MNQLTPFMWNCKELLKYLENTNKVETEEVDKKIEWNVKEQNKTKKSKDFIVGLMFFGTTCVLVYVMSFNQQKYIIT